MALCACSCGTPTTGSEPPGRDTIVNVETVSIPYLKSFCKGNTYRIDRSMAIEGRVVSSDLYGEFPNALILEDAYGGIEILVDEEHYYRRFPIGSAVRVHVDGLMLGDYGGKIQLGLPDNDTLRRIPSEDIFRYMDRADSTEMRSHNTLTINDIDHRWVSRFVRVEEMRFPDEEVGMNFCDYDREGKIVTTERHLIDARLDTLHVRIPYTCTYAEEVIPDGMGAFRGIVDYFNGVYCLRITNREILL